MKPTREDKKNAANLSKQVLDKEDKTSIIKATRHLNNFRKLFNGLCKDCKARIIWAVQKEKRQPESKDYCEDCKNKLGIK